MEILLLHGSGMIEMDFFTESHIYWMQTQNKEKKLQDVEIKNFVVFIKT